MTSAEPVLLTAEQARARSSSIGSWLAGLERRPQRGDRLVLAVDPYHPPVAADLVCAAWGALRHGIVPVILDPGSGERELGELIEDADPVAAIRTPDDLAATLHGPADTDLGTTPRGRPMHYTSGTTGRRKGVFSGVLDEPDAAALWAEEGALWETSARDVHIVMSPLHHSAPLRFALITLLAGGSVVLPGRFEVQAFVEACERHRPTSAFTAPAQLQRLRAVDDATLQQRIAAVLNGFRLLAHAGAPCPEPVKRWLLETVDPRRIWEFYGSTEGQFTACSGPEWLARPGTVGRARPGRSLAVDGDERIWCTVPDFARFTYWNAPEKSAAAWRTDATTGAAAFSVGDAGRLDEDGYLFLHGRRDDLIISGGVNVYPAEVERVLGGLPGVQEIAVFGVTDETWGQRVEAVITGAADPADVLAAAAEHLPAARRPKRVHRVGELPRTATGKILRRDLPALLAEDLPWTPDDEGPVPQRGTGPSRASG